MRRIQKYEFSKAISLKLQKYTNYLQQNKYSHGTIRVYKPNAGIFLQWLEDRKEQIEETQYHSIKDFIISLGEKNYSVRQVNYILISVKHYYNSLDLAFNPILGIQQKGAHKSLRHYFIDYEELVEIFEQYSPGSDDRKFRNKVMLGLMVYQGILVGELGRLKAEEIKVKQGKIEVRGFRNSNRRVLDITSVQLLDLQEYLLEVRPRMLARIKSGEVKKGRGRQPVVDPEIEDKLFFSKGGSADISSSLRMLFIDVQKMNRKVTSGKVIRSTLIIHWLKTHDIRMVQYMAGHKFVSTTERYQAFNFQELEDELRNYHPLR